MNPNWLGLLCSIVSLMAFSLSYRWLKQSTLSKRLIFAIIAIIAALPGLSFSAYYAHIFSEPTWYYEYRSISGIELVIIMIGVAGGIAATLLPRKLLLLPLLGSALATIIPFLKPFVGPLAHEQLRHQWDGDVCMQSTSSTCGAASLATIMRHFGVEMSESEIAKEAHSYAGGTEAWYLARVAKSRGFAVDFVFSSDLPSAHELPAVVGVRLGATGHFIAVLGKHGDSFIVGDPLVGRELLTRDDLLHRYEFTKFRMYFHKK